MTKVNEFIDKNNINGTTKLSKKTPLILKRIFRPLKIRETEPKRSDDF
ncbi:hypothetical protein [Bathymodiolus japonicus methanotrophic gill symbiont]|nr:hypothetical protein [Bathymodiolus japonicus methanotrophic gill symbiont]